MTTSLLLIDDDAGLAQLLQDYLGRHGYAVAWAERPSQGLAMLAAERPALVLLDVMLPEQDGFAVCRQLRAAGNDVPVIMLTAKGDDDDRIAGLQLGADDYLPKPFNPKELLARIEAVLRRLRPVAPAAATPPPAGPVLDPDARTVTVGERRATLTPHEYRIMERLVEAPGRVHSREQLLDALDDAGASEAFDRTIDLHVSRIRQKLEPDPKRPRHLITVWGVGYRFQC